MWKPQFTGIVFHITLAHQALSSGVKNRSVLGKLGEEKENTTYYLWSKLDVFRIIHYVPQEY
jgi:hypothetical protein